MRDVTSTPDALRLPRATGRPTRRFVAAAGAYLAVFVAVYLALVGTESGQRIENAALQAASLRAESVRSTSLAYLDRISVVSIIAAMSVIALIGLARRRPGLGIVAVAVIAVAVVSAEILKPVLPRPALLDGPMWLLRNTFPSGTVTVAASIGLATLIVSPDRLRWLVVVGASIAAAFYVQATQVTGWHRASDAVGGVLLAGFVASVALAGLAATGRTQPSTLARTDHRVFVVVGVVAASAVVAATGLAGAMIAFPVLRAPQGSDLVFLHTISDLLAFGLAITAMSAFAWVIGPYTLGTTEPSPQGTAAAAPAIDRPVPDAMAEESRSSRDPSPGTSIRSDQG
jgi:hypothetical protein